MKNIKTAAVVIQNYIQFESFVNAIDIMIKNKIDVTILVPIEKNDLGFKNMFDSTFEYLKNHTKYQIRRKYTADDYFDLLFMVAPIPQYLELKRKFTIKYMYGYTTKPWYSASPEINNVFDIILTYGNTESFLSAYGKVYPIGNIKYLNFQKKSNAKKKPTLLYLPTYGDDTCIEKIVPELLKIKDKFTLSIKAHHGTNYLINDVENNRRKLIEKNFDNIYNSEVSLLELLKDTDIVISDNSGAIWDAVCSKTPVAIANNNLKEKDYHGFIAEHYKAIKNKDILAINDKTDIKDIITQTLSEEIRNKQNNLFKKLFICENDETENYFQNFLYDLDNNNIYTDEEYYIQQIKKNYINCLNNEVYKLNKDITSISENYQQLFEQFNNFLNEYDKFKKDIYNSTSWKITTPMRKIKMLLLNFKKKR